MFMKNLFLKLILHIMKPILVARVASARAKKADADMPPCIKASNYGVCIPRPDMS